MPSLRRHAPLAVALATCVLVLVATRAELEIARAPLNDHAFHYPLTARLAEAMRSGENPLDCWVSQWTLGHPVPRTYQPLGPLVVAALHVALGGRVELLTLFVGAHWLLLGAFPLVVFAAARGLRLRPWQAAAAAAVAPLVSTDLLYGLDFSSYCWRGSGLFTQEWAQCLMPLAVAAGWRAVRERARLLPAAVLLALAFSAHFVYGLIGAVSIALAAALPALPALTARSATGEDDDDPPPLLAGSLRALRLALLGLLTLALSAWLLVPLWLDRPWVNRSRWEAAWKWDSVGPERLVQLLAKGELLDFGRLPVLTLLALAGVVVVAFRLALRRGRQAETFVVAGTLAWLALFAGRGAWDGLYDLAGMTDVPLHRLVGGVHFFAILLAGVGLAAVAALPAALVRGAELRTSRVVATVASGLMAVLLLAPALKERHEWLKVNATWGRETLALIAQEKGDLDAAVAACRERGGRAFPGSAGGWGKDFGVKWTPFYAFLSLERVPSVSFLYHAMALTSDVMVRFDEWREDHWRVFGVRTGVAPPDRELAPFCREVARFGRFRIFDAPGGGLFDVVVVDHAIRCDRRSLYDVVDAWLFSDGPAQRRHVALDLEGRFPEPGFASLPVDYRLGAGQAREPGRVLSEGGEGEQYWATVQIDDAPAWVLFKMTWHPGWKALVDGAPAPTSHVTPGFVAVKVPAGTHDVRLRYEPGNAKTLLLALVPFVIGAALVLERRQAVVKGEERLAAALGALASRAWAAPRVREAAGVLALAVLAGMPLLLPGLGTGHDAMAYPPRVIEMWENLRHGILVPRWAPDLSAGHGQPFFLYTPPLANWLSWSGFAVTGDLGRGFGVAAFVVLLAGIWALRRVAEEWTSRRASWAAAAAFAFAPYVLVDLYVRAAFTEWTALGLAPLAVLGLVRHARDGRASSLALAACGTALVGLSHHATALLVVPLLAGLALVHAGLARSWRVLLAQAAALATGLLAATLAWMPGLLEADLVHLDRAREGYFHWSTHLVEPWQLLWSPWGFGLSDAGPNDGMSFRLGPLLIALALIAGACAADLARRRAAGSSPLVARTTALLLAALAGSVLMTPASALAWEHLPLLPAVQFPWRLSGAVTLALVLLAALACEGLAARVPARLAAWVTPVVVAALVATGYPLARPASRTYLDTLAWSSDEIARRTLAVTSTEELEPRGVVQRAPYSSRLAVVLEGRSEVEATRETPERWSVVVHAAEPSVIALRLHDFAGWEAEGEGVTKLEPEPLTGRVRLRVEPGLRKATLVLKRTRVQAAGLVLSAAGWAAIAGLALVGWMGRRAEGRRADG